jgi:hypothetical protein
LSSSTIAGKGNFNLQNHMRRSVFVISGLGTLLQFCSQAPGASQSDPLPACVSPTAAESPDSCPPLYSPTFPEIFQHTLSATCATSGVSCHGVDGKQGGLVFQDEQSSYDALLGDAGGGKRRVVPGDVACSEVMVRLDVSGHSWSMPPNEPIDDRVRCSIRKWIASGASREPDGGT